MTAKTCVMRVHGTDYEVDVARDAKYPALTRWSLSARGADVSGTASTVLQALRDARDWLQLSPLSREEAEARLDEHEAIEEELEVMASTLSNRHLWACDDDACAGCGVAPRDTEPAPPPEFNDPPALGTRPNGQAISAWGKPDKVSAWGGGPFQGRRCR